MRCGESSWSTNSARIATSILDVDAATAASGLVYAGEHCEVCVVFVEKLKNELVIAELRGFRRGAC